MLVTVGWWWGGVKHKTEHFSVRFSTWFQYCNTSSLYSGSHHFFWLY